MSIDYYSCKYCGDTFPDCGDYIYCECGESWCSDECAEEDGYIRQHCKLGKEQCDGYPEEECESAYEGRCDYYKHECKNWVEDSCKYCREEDFEDEVLLDYALQKLGLSREDLIKQYKKYTGKS